MTEEAAKSGTLDSPDRPAKRKRITHACKACSSKKTKCDGATPCSGCAASGLLCEYGQQKKRGPPKGFKHGQTSSQRSAESSSLQEQHHRSQQQQNAPSFQPQITFSAGLPTPTYSFPPPSHNPAGSAPSTSFPDAPRLPIQPAGSATLSPRSRPTDVFSLSPTLATSGPGQPQQQHHPPTSYMYMPTTSSSNSSSSRILPDAHNTSRSSFLQGAPHTVTGPHGPSALGLHQLQQQPQQHHVQLPSPFPAQQYPSFNAIAPKQELPDPAQSSFSDSTSSNRAGGLVNSPSSTTSAASAPPHHSTAKQPPAHSTTSEFARVSDAPQATVEDVVYNRRGSWDSPSVSVGGQRLQRLDHVRQIRLPSISEGFGHYDMLMDGAYKSTDSSLGLYRGSTSGLPNLAREQARRAVPAAVNFTSGTVQTPQGKYTTFPMHELEGLSPQIEIPPAMMDELIRVYFAWVQPLWPILYRPRPEQRTVSYASKLPMLLNAMCAWAAALIEPRHHGMDCSNKALSALFRFRAQRIFSGTRCEASVEAVQALHLMALVENANGYCSIAWQLAGLSGRMSLDLGLHRNHKLYRPDIGAEELEDSTRAFCGAYCSDKILAAWLGRPTFVHEQDIDAEYPEQNDIDEHGLWQDRLDALASNKVHCDGEMRCVTYLRAMVSLLTALDNTLCRVYSIRRRRNYREEQDLSLLEDIDNQLLEWRTNLPEAASWQRGRKALPHFLVLHLWFAITRLLLHRTFVPLRHSSWQICTEAAEDIFAIMSYHDQEYGLQVIASSATYAVFTAAVMFIANSSSQHHETASEARRKSKQCILWLNKIGDCWRDATRYSNILTSLEDVGQDPDAESHHSDQSSSRLVGMRPTAAQQTAPPSVSIDAASPTNTSSADNYTRSPSMGHGADLLFWNELPISMDSTHWQNFTTSYSNSLGQNGAGPDLSFMPPPPYSHG